MKRISSYAALLFSSLFFWSSVGAQEVIVGQKITNKSEDPIASDEPVAGPNGERNAPDRNDPLDAQISSHILNLAEGEKERRITFMQVVINDISRICALNPAQKERLKLAAKGAAQRSMKDWHEQAERYFRTRLGDANPDTAKEMLAGMGEVTFGGNRANEEGESLELWGDALSTVLTEEQIAYYEEVLEQRYVARIDAISRMSITTLDSHLRLTPSQKEQIEELVNQAAVDYIDDIRQHWGNYFEKGMLMSLANAAEDTLLKKVLTENQFKRLKDETSSYDHFWDAKKRNRRAEKKAEEQRANEGNEAPEPAAPPAPNAPN